MPMAAKVSDRICTTDSESLISDGPSAGGVDGACKARPFVSSTPGSCTGSDGSEARGYGVQRPRF